MQREVTLSFINVIFANYWNSFFSFFANHKNLEFTVEL